jgi:hypothetical protein
MGEEEFVGECSRGLNSGDSQELLEEFVVEVGENGSRDEG